MHKNCFTNQNLKLCIALPTASFVQWSLSIKGKKMAMKIQDLSVCCVIELIISTCVVGCVESWGLILQRSQTILGRFLNDFIF